jgi:5-methyltetrahydrofolate--homocysteine methyltransferase
MIERDLANLLSQHVMVLADGAMGTILQSAGLQPGGCSEIWNLQRPQEIASVMRSYLEAGAQILQTNTFGASPQKLAQYQLSDRCAEINQAAAQIGREVAGNDALVAGIIGPTGQMLAPLGTLKAYEAEAGFRIQAEALARGGADIICIETMTDLDEASLALRAALTTKLPVVVSMSFEQTPRGFFTIMGVSIQQAVAAYESLGAAAIGSNCGAGTPLMLSIARSIRSYTKLPISIQPNAGLPVLHQGQISYPENPSYIASFVPQFIEAGVSILGGCCGTTPTHISALAQAIREYQR